MCNTIRIATLAALTTVAMLAMTSVASAAAWNASTVYLRMPAKEDFGSVSTQKRSGSTPAATAGTSISPTATIRDVLRTAP